MTTRVFQLLMLLALIGGLAGSNGCKAHGKNTPYILPHHRL